jgi:hypothetical protein
VRWSAGQGIQFGDQEPTEDMRSGTGPQPNMKSINNLSALGQMKLIPIPYSIFRIKLTPAVEHF